MTDYFKDPVLDYEESRVSMRTPQNQINSATEYDDNEFSIPSLSEVPSPTTCPTVANESAQSSEDFVGTPFDRNEWHITDLHTNRRRPPRQHEFLRLLLENPRYSSYISWLDQSKGLFTILLPDEVAALWEKVKSRQTDGEMNYAKFSRGVRHHYKTGLFVKTNKRYTFCFQQPTDDNQS